MPDFWRTGSVSPLGSCIHPYEKGPKPSFGKSSEWSRSKCFSRARTNRNLEVFTNLGTEASNLASSTSLHLGFLSMGAIPELSARMNHRVCICEAVVAYMFRAGLNAGNHGFGAENLSTSFKPLGTSVEEPGARAGDARHLNCERKHRSDRAKYVLADILFLVNRLSRRRLDVIIVFDSRDTGAASLPAEVPSWVSDHRFTFEREALEK